MSIILALDSSTDACSVALNIRGEIQAKFELAAKSHTQRLLPMVDELLAEAQLSLSQLDAIAFGRGPGSFTGLRICMGVVQGLAFGANLPVVPVSTLASMALEFYKEFPEVKLPLLTCLDARMSEVYFGGYHIEQGLPVLRLEESVSAPQALVDSEKIQQLGNQFVAIGQGWHYPAFSQLTPVMLQQDIYPNAESIAKIAAQHVEDGQVQSILDTLPVYLRDNVSWQKRPAARRQIQLD
jgi:tRNA threonylcarbamoyladenosine biosynthesis protein TsaB